MATSQTFNPYQYHMERAKFWFARAEKMVTPSIKQADERMALHHLMLAELSIND